MNEAIHRTVRKIEPHEGQSYGDSLGPFSGYLEIPNIILLGDPGSGKTHTFTVAADVEKAKFLSVRQFLVTGGMGFEEKTLYLDGLDEFRSRVDNKNAIIEVIKLLGRVGRPRVRLSCRIADWLGETDLSLFQSYFGVSQYVVLNLEQLNEEEIAIILHEKGVSDTEEFVKEAKRQGLEELLSNPQTLIMLADVVGRGVWPKTRHDLYERASLILLSEHNQSRMGPGLGQYSAEELVAPAGAACASILISGVEGISLLESQLQKDFPTYRGVPFPDLQKVQASLMRRAFSVVGLEQQAVSYIHRTVAEFLSAQWLADQVRRGLPIRRVQNLLGIEGHPAPELRGLHAWLATLLPEYATLLINNEPYGVLMYGDAASLSPSDRKSLLYALEALSKTNPWFRSSDWSDHPLGALSGPDMVESFQRILSDPDSGFHLRTVVLDAIRNGSPLPQMQDDLRRILSDSKATYRERSNAVDGLLKIIPDGEQDVVEVYRSILLDNPSALRLRAEIIARLYSKKYFTIADVVSLFNDILDDSDEQEHVIGELWGITYSLPEGDLPNILDNLCELQIREDFDGSLRNEFEFKSAFSRMLSRILNSKFPKQPEQLWRWLKALHRLRGYSGSGKGDIQNWLSKNKQIVLDMFKIVYDRVQIDIKRRISIYEFQRITMLSVSDEDFAKYVLEILKSKEAITEEYYLLYEICGRLVFASEPVSRDLFEEFYSVADAHSHLQEIREQFCRCEIEDWRLKDTDRKLQYQTRQKIVRETNRSNLEKTKDNIRAGLHLHNLGFLAKIYFGLLSDIDNKLPPIERLRSMAGDDLLIDAVEGFSAVIRRSDLPSPIEVASLDAKGRYFEWWYAVLTGMDEAWQGEPELDRFPDELLKSALAISFVLNTYEVYEQNGRNIRQKTAREWRECLFTERPDLVQRVFEDWARVGLGAKRSRIPVLTDLVHNKQTEPWRGKLALRLLSEFPSTVPGHLHDLVLAAIFDTGCHNDLLELAKATTTARGRIKGEQRAIWFAIGFLLDFDAFQSALVKYAKPRDQVIWILKDIIQHAQVRGSDKRIALSIEQLETIIRLVGKKFANVSLPKAGWCGDRHPWDASEFVRQSINALSAIPELGASEALRRLTNDNTLASYQDHLRHALASQANIRRQVEYAQPTWSETIGALRGGKPANIADLHAFILDHLETLKKEIRHSNTDIYKRFWQVRKQKAIECPDIEDNCRDRLIDLLRPRLLPLGIRIEPEGHMADDKRADIVILPPPGQKLPLELKRDTHGDLWEACINQLERLYTRDPEAAGYGIYVVFWFGDKREGNIQAPPRGIARPTSAEDLEAALRSLIPNDRRHRLEAVVLDVTPPT
ncbi:MAG: NACHT domain-containing protein [Desulfobaccales bacterium]